MKKLLGALMGLGLLAAGSGANAHTTSIGYENAGIGSLNFWYGTYHTLGELPSTEGSFQLVGINGNLFPLTTTGFSMFTGVKPAGLMDGVTNFYASGALNSASPLVSVDPLIIGGPQSWQGVNFAGLNPGDYQFTYIPIVNPSVKWDPWNNAVRTNTVNITGTVLMCGDPGQPPCDTTPMVEPGTLAIFGLGLAGLGIARRRKAIA